jgi:hypothetical protein
MQSENTNISQSAFELEIGAVVSALPEQFYVIYVEISPHSLVLDLVQAFLLLMDLDGLWSIKSAVFKSDQRFDQLVVQSYQHPTSR